MDTAVSIRLSLDGVTDHQSQYAQNKREEFDKKLNSLLNEFLSKNNEFRDFNILKFNNYVERYNER